MRFNKLSRFVGALCLAGSVTYVAAAPAPASTPAGWTAAVVPLPAKVHNGADAGYRITITNGATSNISQLSLSGTDSPTFVGGPNGGSCSKPGVPLTCSFGSLPGSNQAPRNSVTIIVAYKTPATGQTFAESWVATTTGSTTSDGGTSHGDTLAFSSSTSLTPDANFGGGFDKDRSTIGNDGSLGTGNQQSTQVTPPVAGVIATVQDGPDVSFDCQSACTKTPFGEWSQVTVGAGDTFYDTNGNPILFPVTLLVYGKTMPSGVKANSIQLVHVLDSNQGVDVLSTKCGATPTLNCLTVTKVGPNFKITGWVDQNGGFKGMG
jgi:hypothetical protein